MTTYTAEELINSSDMVLPVSEWIEINQPQIDAFADLTHDRQFIHVDPVRTQAETSFGGTIAHGFFSLSLLSGLSENKLPTVKGATETLNYGMDKLRFLAPVPSGSRIRAHFKLLDCRLKDPGRLLLRHAVSVEIENHDTPALVCEWLALVLFKPSSP